MRRAVVVCAATAAASCRPVCSRCRPCTPGWRLAGRDEAELDALPLLHLPLLLAVLGGMLLHALPQRLRHHTCGMALLAGHCCGWAMLLLMLRRHVLLAPLLLLLLLLGGRQML